MHIIGRVIYAQTSPNKAQQTAMALHLETLLNVRHYSTAMMGNGDVSLTIWKKAVEPYKGWELEAYNIVFDTFGERVGSSYLGFIPIR